MEQKLSKSYPLPQFAGAPVGLMSKIKLDNKNKPTTKKTNESVLCLGLSLTLMPSNLDNARKGLNALNVLRDFIAAS